MIDINTPAPVIRLGSSGCAGAICCWSGRIGVWVREGTWKPLGVFRYFRGRKGLFKGVLFADRKYAIRTRESELVLRGPQRKLRVEYVRSWWSMAFRWSWRGEDCALEVSSKLDLGALKLRIGATDYTVNTLAPAPLVFVGGSQERVLADAPHKREKGEFITPRPERMDRAQLFHILLLALMVRAHFEQME